MPIKTILVHLSDDADHMPRLEGAIELARRFGAHLTAAYVEAPIHGPSQMTGRGASLGYLAAASEDARRHADKVEAEFRTRCERDDIAFEWRVGAGEPGAVIGALSAFADLTIVSQFSDDPAFHRLALPFPDDLPFTAAGPVLIVPPGYGDKPIATRILVAWKHDPHAARAVRAAIPFMRQAKAVTIYVARERGDEDLPGAEIGPYLDRHGVDVEMVIDNHAGGDVAETLVSKAGKRGTDLIVMGAYSHSRLREMVLGSVTRHLLTHAPVPVLMAH
jgi:nucleotide-binding universal stress UspA family protein